MAQNITLLGASYSDVPAVTLPKTGGGTAKFTDTTPTTASASDVASGKIFFDSSGTQQTGTASGGGGGGGIEITQDDQGYIVLPKNGGGGGGGGGSGWTLLASQEQTINIRPSDGAYLTLSCGAGAYSKDHMIVGRVYRKNGAKENGTSYIFYCSMSFLENIQDANGSSADITSILSETFYYKEDFYRRGFTATGECMFMQKMTSSGDAVFNYKNNASYQMYFPDTYVFEVWQLEYPNSDSIFDPSHIQHM